MGHKAEVSFITILLCSKHSTLAVTLRQDPEIAGFWRGYEEDVVSYANDTLLFLANNKSSLHRALGRFVSYKVSSPGRLLVSVPSNSFMLMLILNLSSNFKQIVPWENKHSSNTYNDKYPVWIIAFVFCQYTVTGWISTINIDQGFNISWYL